MTETILVIAVRSFWGVFLGCLLSAGFRQSWNVEHGGKRGWAMNRPDTAVWMDPVVFPVILALYMVLYVCFFGVSYGIEYMLSMSIDILVFISLYFTLLLAALPLLRRYYTARTCATLWLIPVFLFYQPNLLYNLRTGPPLAVLYIPGQIMKAALLVWIAGFVLLFGFQVLMHLRFSRMLERHSVPALDEEKELWEKTRKDLEVDLPVRLRRSPLIRTPLTAGMRKKNRVTYLPERTYTPLEAELVFAHELHHIQRNDTHTKFFLCFCRVFGWIHPFVWTAVRRAEDDLELSCDEIVLKDADAETRRKYAELLLATAGDSRGFTTCLSASARSLRYRMRATIRAEGRRLGTGLLFAIMFLSVFSTGWIAVSSSRASVAEILDLEESGLSDVSVAAGDKGEKDVGDTEKLTACMAEFEAEEMLWKYTALPELPGPVLTGLLPQKGSFRLTDRYLEVRIWGKQPRLYHLTEPVDWAQMEAIE